VAHRAPARRLNAPRPALSADRRPDKTGVVVGRVDRRGRAVRRKAAISGLRFLYADGRGPACRPVGDGRRCRSIRNRDGADGC
jgi:hypothetical protein